MILGLTGSEAWRGKRAGPRREGGFPAEGGGGKGGKRRGSAGLAAGGCCWSERKAASGGCELGESPRGGSAEFGVGPGKCGIVEPGVGGSGSGELGRGGFLAAEGEEPRRLVVRAVPGGLCAGSSRFGVSSLSWRVEKNHTLRAFVQETVSPEARREPGWPGL